MAFFAKDLNTNEVHSVEWFLRNHLKTGACTVCDSQMSLRAQSTSNRRAHFCHPDHSSCPTVIRNRVKYSHLTARNIDTEQGKIFRAQVKENLHDIYHAYNSILGRTHKFSLFKELVEKASKMKVWDYVGITLNYVPYILLTLNDDYFILPGWEKGKENEFFVIFDTNLQFFDDLWNDCNLKKKVWKISKTGEFIEILDIASTLETVPVWFKNYQSILKL